MNYVCLKDMGNRVWYINLSSVDAVEFDYSQEGRLYSIKVLFHDECCVNLALNDEQTKKLLDRLEVISQGLIPRRT